MKCVLSHKTKPRDKFRSFIPPNYLTMEKMMVWNLKCQTILLCSAVHNATIQSRDEETRDGKGKVRRDIHHESQWFTKVHGELDAASVQLQSQGVRGLLGGGGHEQAICPLRHEAQRHVLGLRVHSDRHDDLQVHAAVITQHRRLWIGWRRGQRSDKEGNTLHRMQRVRWTQNIRSLGYDSTVSAAKFKNQIQCQPGWNSPSYTKHYRSRIRTCWFVSLGHTKKRFHFLLSLMWDKLFFFCLCILSIQM